MDYGKLKATDTLHIGSAVDFYDSRAKRHPALVTSVHGQTWIDPENDRVVQEPAINLVYVNDDEAMTDVYGRQIGRETSVVHRTSQPAGGMYWVRVQ